MQQEMLDGLRDVKKIVTNWTDSYIAMVDGPGCEALVEDLIDEIGMYVYPFMRRVYGTEAAPDDDIAEVFKHCMSEVRRLQRAVLEG